MFWPIPTAHELLAGMHVAIAGPYGMGKTIPAVNPRYHVFVNGLCTMPNDLVEFQQALKRYEACVERMRNHPRATVTLRKRGLNRPLRQFYNRPIAVARNGRGGRKRR